MLKIDVAMDAGTAALSIEGQVIGPWVGELERVCGSLLSSGTGLTVDLARVSFLSHEGAALLLRLREGGVLLANCSPLVAEQLRAHERRAR